MLEDQMVATRETEKISVANDDHSKFFILNETQERWIQKNTEKYRKLEKKFHYEERRRYYVHFLTSHTQKKTKQQYLMIISALIHKFPVKIKTFENLSPYYVQAPVCATMFCEY